MHLLSITFIFRSVEIHVILGAKLNCNGPKLIYVKMKIFIKFDLLFQKSLFLKQRFCLIRLDLYKITGICPLKLILYLF